MVVKGSYLKWSKVNIGPNSPITLIPKLQWQLATDFEKKWRTYSMWFSRKSSAIIVQSVTTSFRSDVVFIRLRQSFRGPQRLVLTSRNLSIAANEDHMSGELQNLLPSSSIDINLWTVNRGSGLTVTASDLLHSSGTCGRKFRQRRLPCGPW